jgi:hypothetical protein
MAYEPTFTGGVHVTMGDINDDNILDLITGPDVGGGQLVKVFDGRNGALLRAFNAYDPEFRGGVHVAVGRLEASGDFIDDIVTGAGVSGAPHVKYFNGATGGEIESFMAFDPASRNGVSVAIVNSAGASFAQRVVAAPGPGGGPVVKFFGTFIPGTGQQYVVGPPSDRFGARTGITIAVGDINGDRYGDLIVGSVTNGSPQVGVFNVSNLNNGPVLIRQFLPYEPAFRGGVRVAAADLNFDGIADILTAPEPGNAPLVRAFDGPTGANILNFLAFDPAFTGGVFVG